MLSTIVISAYGPSERTRVNDALEEICSAHDNYGWASSGIYCFWDPSTKNVLYVGLAVDLAQRFRQHNGLVPAEANTCKRQQIDEFFRSNARLGFSIMLQSRLSQVVTANSPPELIEDLQRQAEANPTTTPEELAEQASRQGFEQIQCMEGYLLDGYKVALNTLPPWNKIKGYRFFQAKRPYAAPLELLDAMTARRLSTLVAKRNLFQLASEVMSLPFEEVLHAARVNQIWLGLAWDDALSRVSDELGYLTRMKREGYLELTPAPENQ
jgi:hypothetical protein